MDIKWIKETFYKIDDKKATLKVPPVVIVDLVDHVEKLQAQLARAIGPMGDDFCPPDEFKRCSDKGIDVDDDCILCVADYKKYIMEGE